MAKGNVISIETRRETWLNGSRLSSIILTLICLDIDIIEAFDSQNRLEYMMNFEPSIIISGKSVYLDGVRLVIVKL